jgi:hypothetical protein
MFDRRRFLIGAGGLLTASFVHKAAAFNRGSVAPLLLPPTRKPEETLYVYRKEDVEYDDAEWRVSLGPNQPFAPPPPTWREHLRSLGYRLDSDNDIKRVCVQVGIEPQDLDARVNGFSWEDRWDNFDGPQARAFHLLKNLDLGAAADSRLKQAGQIIFEEFGCGPGFDYHWVELKDDLTVSLLQGRLIELGLPINVVVGGPLGASA